MFYRVLNTRLLLQDNFLALKREIVKTLPDCKVIFSKPRLRTHNGKALLVKRNLNAHLPNVKFVDNSNICAECIGQKGFHLGKKGKKG